MDSPEALQLYQEKVHGGRHVQISPWGSMHVETAGTGVTLRSQTRAVVFDWPIEPKWVQKLAGMHAAP